MCTNDILDVNYLQHVKEQMFDNNDKLTKNETMTIMHSEQCKLEG